MVKEDQSTKPLLYLAGGMYSGWQDKVKRRLGDKVRYYDPRTDANQDCLADLTVADRDNAKACQIMLAYFEKDNPSGLGMAAEIGMAVGTAKIYLVDEHNHIHGFLAALCSRIYTDLDAALNVIEHDLESDTHFSWSRSE
jgi:hypothetical protein